MSENRPVKLRRGARLIVLAGSRVLLQRDTDPGVAGSSWWVTPGGGVDDGEDYREAAVRELREETGLVIDRDHLEGPVLQRRAVHGYSDRILVQDEQFFRVRTTHFEPVPAALTDAELTRVKEVRWHDLDHLPEPLWPANLARHVDNETLVDGGVMDESTVALEPGMEDLLRELPSAASAPDTWQAARPG